jgi:2-methylcitrate synthase
MHSCITAAIGALRGPLHGGANEAAMNLIAKFSSPDEAEKGVSGHGCVSVMISTNGQ